MRSIWNGAISFGLVSIPVKVVNATQSHAISFRQIHLDGGGRIRYRKVCELEGSEVSTSEIGKAYEDADGTLIPITDEDLASLPIPTARTIEIVADRFVRAGWRSRSSSWHGYELEIAWCQVEIDPIESSEALLNGVADPERFDELGTLLHRFGFDFSLELYDGDCALIREIST